jgi:organic hydroperoxide reductase OsmC/OhrA
MGEYTAVIEWKRAGAIFADNRYSRRHLWRFDGGIEVPASSSPHVVPLPMSAVAAVDPEEAFVASLSSCHMLWFLSIAGKRGFVVESYRDDAVGVMARNSTGKMAMTLVTLRPAVDFAGEKLPTAEEVITVHHEAHEQCFIANSVKTEVRCEPILHAAVTPAREC